MKLTAILLGLAFLTGVAVGATVVKSTTAPTAPVLVLDMTDSAGHTVTRTYPAVSGWNYKVVSGHSEMHVSFQNPTLYRCGFEP